MPINADVLGEDYAHLKAGHEFFNIAGRISIDMIEAHDVLCGVKGWRWKLAKLFLAYGLDISWRSRSKMARRLTWGAQVSLGCI